MRKYRIIEHRGLFYPQEKKFISWVYIDNWIPAFVWSSKKKAQSKCHSLNEAKEAIEKRIKFLEDKEEKIIIHPYL